AFAPPRDRRPSARCPPSVALQPPLPDRERPGVHALLLGEPIRRQAATLPALDAPCPCRSRLPCHRAPVYPARPTVSATRFAEQIRPHLLLALRRSLGETNGASHRASRVRDPVLDRGVQHD